MKLGINNNRLQIDIANTIGYTFKVQLFSSFISISEIDVNKEWSFSNPYYPLPYTKYNKATYSTPAINASTCFNIYGDLISFNNLDDTKILAVSCPQVPYKTVLNYFAFKSMVCKKMRITTKIAAQFNNSIFITKRDIFGTVTRDEIEISRYTSPNNVQENIIDVPVQFELNGMNGIEFDILNSNYVGINFYF